MRTRALGVGLVLLLGGVWTGPLPAEEGRETYRIDGAHSTVLFGVGHFGASRFWGRFNEMSGTIEIDRATPTNSTVSIEIRAASVDTANERRDEHLKSPDFFNVRQHPTITFSSTGMEAGEGEGRYRVTGDLTILGTTRPVTLEVEHVGSGEDRQGTRREGFEITGSIDRTEFGMTYGEGMIGNEVRLLIGIEAARQ